jgi:hypothetical protein
LSNKNKGIEKDIEAKKNEKRYKSERKAETKIKL